MRQSVQSARTIGDKQILTEPKTLRHELPKTEYALFQSRFGLPDCLNETYSVSQAEYTMVDVSLVRTSFRWLFKRENSYPIFAHQLEHGELVLPMNLNGKVCGVQIVPSPVQFLHVAAAVAFLKKMMYT